MNHIKIVSIALTLLVFGGCASKVYKPTEYMDRHSRAFNISRAGGLVTGMADSKAPKGVKDITGSLAYGAATTGVAAFSAGALGLLDWQNAALNALFWAASPGKHGARNSIMAWMPATEATSPKDAQMKLARSIQASTKKILLEMGAEIVAEPFHNGSFIFVVSSTEWGCFIDSVDDVCKILVSIKKPKTGQAPSFISGVKGSVFAFTSEDTFDYHKITITNSKTSIMPQGKIYEAISKDLPSWAYIYLAPKKVFLSAVESTLEPVPLRYPVLLEQGKAELFIYPDKSKRADL